MHPQIRDAHNAYVNHIDGTHTRTAERHRHGTYMIRKGDRIAQGVIAQVPRATFALVEDLNDTARGVGGFGHTGTN